VSGRYALDLPAAIQRFQRTSPVPIEVEDVMWVPDRGIATRIAQAVLATIAKHRAPGGWHDVPAASVAGKLGLTTVRLYPEAVTVPHDLLVKRWANERAS
jgi:hypothetical protein